MQRLQIKDRRYLHIKGAGDYIPLSIEMSTIFFFLLLRYQSIYNVTREIASMSFFTRESSRMHKKGHSVSKARKGVIKIEKKEWNFVVWGFVYEKIEFGDKFAGSLITE